MPPTRSPSTKHSCHALIETRFLAGHRLTNEGDGHEDFPGRNVVARVPVINCSGEELLERRFEPVQQVLMILGNLDSFLHAHIIPRYDWEPAEFQPGPSVLYPIEQQTDPATLLGPQHDGLRADLIAEIGRMRAPAPSTQIDIGHQARDEGA